MECSFSVLPLLDTPVRQPDALIGVERLLPRVSHPARTRQLRPRLRERIALRLAGVCLYQCNVHHFIRSVDLENVRP
jgi:hypothetical protein